MFQIQSIYRVRYETILHICYKYRSFAGPRELTYNKGTQPVKD